MSGILARGEPRLAAVDNVHQAWNFIRRNAQVDLVFSELTLSGTSGLALVQRLKNDSLLKLLPIVIYAEHGDRNSVKRALELHVQNFLVKPYHDDDIFAEIDKAEVNPWRDRFFEEEKSFCKLMGFTPKEVHRLLDELRVDLIAAREPLKVSAAREDYRPVADLVRPLRELAEAAGAWGAVECLNNLTEHSSAGAWSAFPGDLESLDFAIEMIAIRIDDQHLSPDFCLKEEHSHAPEAAERAAWAAAPLAGRCPVLTWEQLQREIDGLRGCPVIDSAAAEFQMVANGHPSCINPLMDLVARDPGLSAQMLIAANRTHPPKQEDTTQIEDARLAVAQLGEMRLLEQARTLVLAEARVMNLPPAFSWPRFWTFQRAVARLAQLTCRDLEFYSLEPVARTAGQLHDIGKLLLAHLHPAGFQAILEHARLHRVPLSEAEKLFLGCTTSQMAAYFADKFGLSRRFANVMRWIDDPTAATEDANLVAIISLARDLCRHNQVGTSGDPTLEHPLPLEETTEWQILRESLYPSFDLRKFEVQVHAYCGQLKTEFSGHQSGTVGELVAHAAS